MYSKVISGVLEGIDGRLVQVEADISNGLPVFDMVGYLASEVKEARERVRTAMKNQGYLLPPKRITVNLSPANIRKSGSLYDLPVAMAVLLAGSFLKPLPMPVLFLGELGLDGSIKKIQGVLPLVLCARAQGIKVCVVPEENQREGAMAEGIFCIGRKDLQETVEFFHQWTEAGGGEEFLKCMDMREKCKNTEEDRLKKAVYEKEKTGMDFADIKGQRIPRRAIEIAVSGHHNLLMTGPPGSGKTALAQRIPTIMPALTPEESLELTKIYSVKGLLPDDGKVMTKRPFRAPHHTVTTAAMAGGGKNAAPGEISLADKGILFLDELPEYNRYTLEVMRQPLEEGKVVIARNQRSCVYPADFMLVAAMNPCPCGYFPDRKRCFCTERQIRCYQGRISGPLLDRIDLMVRVNPISYEEFRNGKAGESSKEIQKRVEQTRKVQRERFTNENYRFNSQMNQKGLERYCKLSENGEKQMEELFAKYELSVRGYGRILKLARTIADMEGKEQIEESHLCEAAVFRMGWEYEKI